ncbi:MAG: hypothetical protein CL927_02610 [Deltaproteobacteria bacterium]|nr:hypothetical protein [Deltaproteobacteria bacterium]HCH66921.1 hypothetical protein [Deltaproteobacteria bacterium]
MVVWWLVVGTLGLGFGTASAAEATCGEGEVVVNRGASCCWEGQHWDRRRKQCAGVPRSCPEGWSVVVPVPASSGPPDCVDLKSGSGRHTALQASEDTRGFLDGTLNPEGTLVGTAPAAQTEPASSRTTRPQAAPSTPAGALAPGLSHGSLTVRGALDPRQFGEALRGRGELLGACLDLTRIERPGARGAVTLEVAVNASGAITGASVVSDSIDHGPTTQCFRDVLPMVRLPDASGSSTVVVPLQLQL